MVKAEALVYHKIIPMPISEVDRARLAAYIDGEGNINICAKGMKGRRSRKTPSMLLRVEICNTDIRLTEWCKRVTGVGNVTMDHRTADHRRGGTRRFLYRWMACDRQAERIINECLPFFVIKREQAEIALAFRRTFTHLGGRTTEYAVGSEKLALRYHLKDELHRLKNVAQPNGLAN